MRAILRFLASRWFLSFIGVVLLGVLVWWFGPFLSLLEGWIARAAVIAVMLLIWGGTNFLLDRRRKRTDAALVEGVAAGPVDTSAAASAEEAAKMRERLTTALTLLKKASASRGYLYEQPWYAIIGPPGTGKTTALLNAGLTFPLAAEMGQKVSGFGGTRMCDWWFTDEAVLIDTAGRYTSQDDATVDRAGWDAFLNLLRKTRGRQPLNGLIVAFSLQDERRPDSSIGGSTAAQRSAHAQMIRRRIKEVYEKLGVRVPVYLLFTKADLVDGFTDFFDDMDRERQGQVWGITFPSDVTGGPTGTFRAEFEILLERLNERLINRLQNERGADHRTAIAGFPAQMASLGAPLTDFINEAFGDSRMDPAPVLRGVYFTSGTQEGTPIDRLNAVMARNFGIDQVRAASLVPVKGRSYFLTRLLKSVILGEAMLVSRDPARQRRRLLLRAATVSLAVLVALGGIGALLQTRSVNLAAVARANQALAAYDAAARALPLDPVRDDDLTQVLPLLDQARALPFGGSDAVVGKAWFPGLSQIGKLEAGARIVYRHALENILLPRLITRLESQMRQNFAHPAFLYEATRVYLELGSAGPLDPALVREWMHYDWQSTWPGPAGEGTRKDLERHLAALLDAPLPKIPLDGALVEDARRTFSRVSLAERVYSLVRRSPQAAALPEWRPSEAAGVSGAQLFGRRSGQPMTEGVPGFFTVDGFYKVLLPSLPAAVREVASESWVLGKRVEIDPNSPAALSLRSDVIKLYSADYIRTWDGMLADLDLRPLGSLQNAVQTLYLLSSPQSPMRDLLTGIVRQLTLTVPPAPKAASGAVAAARGAVAKATSSVNNRLAGMFHTGNTSTAEPPGKSVEAHYAALIAYVGKGPGAPIDNVLKLMNDLQQQLSRLATAIPGSVPPPGSDDPAALLDAEASRAPDPIRRWILAVSASGNALRSGGAKKGAAEAFNAPGGPASLCRQAVGGRYPFSPGSANDIPLDDFARLFAPNGMLDQFFTTQLRPFVDTSGRVWRVQPVAGVAPPISAGALAEFQRAALIRDLFFGTGGTQPSVRFDIEPVSIDDGAKQVTLDLDGTSVVYAHGPMNWTSVTWPGPNRMNRARLVFDPPPSSGPTVLQATGPWALFRLFGQGSLVQEGAADRYRLTFRLGDRKAVFEIRAGSVLNPFQPGILRDFRCPSL